VTHGRAAFAGPAVPGALCREFPLGRGCAKSNQACAERIALSVEARIPVVVSGSSITATVPNPVAEALVLGPWATCTTVDTFDQQGNSEEAGENR
jgi:hypothetical protein